MFPLGLIGPRFGPLCSLELGVLIGHGDFIGSRWGHLLQFNSILKKNPKVTLCIHGYLQSLSLLSLYEHNLFGFLVDGIKVSFQHCSHLMHEFIGNH